jgi:hypothetical protein
MDNNEFGELSRLLVESFIDSKNEGVDLKLESNCEASLNRLNVIFEQFQKQIYSLKSFVKEISFSTRTEQAKFIKINYGTKNVKSRICFRLIDSQSLKLKKEEEVDLFIFIGKNIDAK